MTNDPYERFTLLVVAHMENISPGEVPLDESLSDAVGFDNISIVTIVCELETFFGFEAPMTESGDFAFVDSVVEIAAMCRSQVT